MRRLGSARKTEDSTTRSAWSTRNVSIPLTSVVLHDSERHPGSCKVYMRFLVLFHDEIGVGTRCGLQRHEEMTRKGVGEEHPGQVAR